MADLERDIIDALLRRRLGGDQPAPVASGSQPSTTSSPEVSERDRVQAITGIIAEAYAMPNVPEHVKRRCAKRRIEAEYGVEHATKFLRGRKRTKVPTTEATPPPPAVEPSVPVPTPTEPTPAAAAPTPAATPTLALNDELQKILKTKEAAPTQ